MKMYAMRLKPGQDLRFEVEKFAHDNNIQSGCIVSCVGSLSHVNLRMADATPENKEYKNMEGTFEIVSLVGTVSTQGYHLHMAVSDEKGQVTGGHLTEDNIVHTTAEIVIFEDETVTYNRELDDQTGFPELVIKSKKSNS